MTLEDFTRDSVIFRDESVLRESYTPSRLLEREEELRSYQNALQPVINSAPPKNIFVYGQTGVGKSLSTSLVLNKLQEDAEQYDDVNIEVVSVVCKSLTSSYQVAVRLVNELCDAGNKIAKRGHSEADVYEMLWDELNSIDASHCLFVLDEIDSIGNDDTILYQLPRCTANGSVNGTMVGVIGISNDFTFRDQLSARVQDTLCDEEIHFPPYDSEELRTILAHRIERAFIDGVVGDDVVPLCAAYAARESGSARLGLRILYKAGDLARATNQKTVTEKHVEEALETVKQSRIRDELESLPTHSHLVLGALLTHSERGELPVKRKDIYKQYRVYANNFDFEVKTARTIHNRLSDLAVKGFVTINERNQGIKGGNYYEYDLNIDSELVRDVLTSSSEFGERL